MAQAPTNAAPPEQLYELPGLEGRWTMEQLVEMDLQRDPRVGQASLCRPRRRHWPDQLPLCCQHFCLLCPSAAVAPVMQGKQQLHAAPCMVEHSCSLHVTDTRGTLVSPTSCRGHRRSLCMCTLPNSGQHWVMFSCAGAALCAARRVLGCAAPRPQPCTPAAQLWAAQATGRGTAAGGGGEASRDGGGAARRLRHAARGGT